MTFLVDGYEAIRDFFEAGGGVLYWILFVTIFMWTLIVERIWYLYFVMPRRLETEKQAWEARGSTQSWAAKRIRDAIISRVRVDAHQSILVIKTLMAILPLLGLFGTVWGMIQVFEIMAIFGTGNARLMAGGVSKATIPTMAGLVAALSGLYLSTHLEHRANTEVERLEDMLVHH
ncbi:MAG: MotA/TolQ/ExbB proton channel family protein [Gammaproteobacteria bacterium]|nr:MotA/TolQ/ExbB proton channel family protein [Gammaproteobacteria bacterium]